jgi:hypothetical protein
LVAEDTIVFGRPPVLTLEVKRRLLPDGSNYVDRNMLAVNVTVAAGRFRGFWRLSSEQTSSSGFVRPSA